VAGRTVRLGPHLLYWSATMVQVFKPTYRDKRTGEVRQTDKWYARIGGKRVPLGTTDKRVAERKAVDLERVAELGYNPTALDRARRQPIVELVVEFEQAIAAKGIGQGHLKNLVPRIERIVAECSIKCLNDIDAAKVENWLSRQQKTGGMSVGTRKHYATNAKQFGKWLAETGRIARNPFAGLRTNLNVQANRKHIRRALTEAECRTLLMTVRASPATRGKMCGECRYQLYGLALGTGLRRNELGSLTPGSFCLDGPVPTVTVPAGITKNRKAALLPVRPDHAAELRAWLAGQDRGKVLFPVAGKQVQLALHKDLEDAGIARVEDGKTFDFHGLRHSFITHLARAGVPLATTQRLARHSDPRLTACTYTHLGISDLGAAVERLPSLRAEPEPSAPQEAPSQEDTPEGQG
jgi:integrase